MMAGFLQSALFVLTLLGAWCFGNLVFKRGSLDLALGLLSFVGIYAACRLFGVSSPMLALLFSGAILFFGCLGLLLTLQKSFVRGLEQQGPLRLRLAACFFGWCLGRLIPFNPYSLDLKHYTMEQAWAFAGSEWIQDNPVLHPQGLYLYNLIQASRTGVGAFGWISALPQVSLDRGFVMQLILALLFLAALEWWTLLKKSGLASAPVAWLVVASFPVLLNPNHLVAAMLGGHINQVLGGLSLVLIVRLIFEMGEKKEEKVWDWRGLISLFTCGVTLLFVYPEMGVVLPIYFFFAVALSLRGRQWWVPLLALALGFGLPALLRFTELAEFLSGQIKVGVQWAPMVGFARNPFCYISLLIHGGYHKFLVPILLLSWLLLAKNVRWRELMCLEVLLFCGSFGAIFCFAVLKTGEVHYMVFKLSGWLLPLFALAWFLLISGWWRSSEGSRPRGQQKFAISVGIISMLLGLAPLRALKDFGISPPSLEFLEQPVEATVEVRPIPEMDLVYSEDWSRAHAPTRGLRVKVAR